MTETDTREPIRHATYPGDTTAMAGQVRPLGPNLMGEWFWPVTATYDPEAKKTRVGFSLIPHPSLTPGQELHR